MEPKNSIAELRKYIRKNVLCVLFADNASFKTNSVAFY